MAQYFIDTLAGNDANNGLTWANRWLTYAHAGTVMLVGDTLSTSAPTASDYCSLADVKNYGRLNQDASGNLASGKDDNLIGAMITAFSREIDTYCMWQFSQQTVTNKLFQRPYLTIDNDGRMWIRTNSPMLTSVTSVQYKKAWKDTWSTVDPSFIFIDTPLDNTVPPNANSPLIGVDLNFYPNRMVRYWAQVSYVGGYPVIPSEIAETCRQLVFWEYKLREARPTSMVAFPNMGMISRPDEWPVDLRRALNPWKNPLKAAWAK